MSNFVLIGVAVIWINAFAFYDSAAADTLSNKIRKQLLNRILSEEFQQKFICRGETICGTQVIPLFYERRDFRPAWITEDGSLPQVESLIRAIKEADREGLRPSDYHLASIESLLAEVRQDKAEKKPPDQSKLADLDLVLTDAFLLYGSHLLAGRVNPETIHTQWVAYSPTVDLAEIFQSALDSNQIEKTLKGLMPTDPGYARLREALLRYRDMAKKSGWPAMPLGSTMKKGDRGERVRLLRRHLEMSGFLPSSNTKDENLFDNQVEQAVLKFQEENELQVDGIVGPVTLAALNVPVEEHVRQIELNMERWRWIPHDLGQRYILINIANYELRVVENGKTAMKMRVVVGRPYRRTPVFSKKITYMVLNPYWNVPRKIAVKDLLPKIQENPDYFAEQGMRVFQSWESGAPEIKPETIDWSQVNARNFSYKFRQDPGPQNALGRVKFMLPNKFDVYLHDTPKRELFDETQRSFSSGCIRIEKPIELAEYLLRDDPEWTREKLLAAIDSGETRIVRLRTPIPVHLLYWTVWVDENGTVFFRNDIYNRDKDLDKALSERPPNP